MQTSTALPQPKESPKEGLDEGWHKIQNVRCSIVAEMDVRGFTVRDLLLLQPGSVVNTRQSVRGRIALLANGSFIAWGEFDVVSDRLGVRFTELG